MSDAEGEAPPVLKSHGQNDETNHADFGPKLGSRALAAGYAIRYCDISESTNEDALRAARAGEVEADTWFVARAQSAGRGRRGRQWISPPGNLYASLLLLDPCASERAPELGFVAGVALYNAIRPRIGSACSFGLKWPNDLLYDGAKLSGMLLEATRLPSGVLGVVIGVGVNCRSHPQGLDYKTTDLDAIAAGTGDVAQCFSDLSDSLARSLKIWDRGEGFPAIRAEWLRGALGLGQRITVALGDKTLDGVFETIDPGGRLVLQTVDGEYFIDAGDVLLGQGA